MNLQHLYEIICSRRDQPQTGSYTASLFSSGRDEMLKKVGEEAVEVVLAGSSQGRQRLVEEISDLAYHVLVLMADEGIAPADIEQELGRRHRKE